MLGGGLVGAGVSFGLLAAGVARRRHSASWYGERVSIKRYSGAGLLVGGAAALLWSGGLVSTTVWVPPADRSDQTISFAASGVVAVGGVGMLIGGALVRRRWMADGARLTLTGGPTVGGGSLVIAGAF